MLLQNAECAQHHQVGVLGLEDHASRDLEPKFASAKQLLLLGHEDGVDSADASGHLRLLKSWLVLHKPLVQLI